MPSGGTRPGAGRKRKEEKPTPLARRTRAVAEKAIQDGELTPLEVILKAMRHHAKDERWDEAAAFAKDAAPYMHPRLASIAHTGKDGGPIATYDLSKLTNAQLAQVEPLLSMLAAAGAPAGASTH